MGGKFKGQKQSLVSCNYSISQALLRGSTVSCVESLGASWHCLEHPVQHRAASGLFSQTPLPQTPYYQNLDI